MENSGIDEEDPKWQQLRKELTEMAEQVGEHRWVDEEGDKPWIDEDDLRAATLDPLHLFPSFPYLGV